MSWRKRLRSTREYTRGKEVGEVEAEWISLNDRRERGGEGSKDVLLLQLDYLLCGLNVGLVCMTMAMTK